MDKNNNIRINQAIREVTIEYDKDESLCHVEHRDIAIKFYKKQNKLYYDLYNLKREKPEYITFLAHIRLLFNINKILLRDLSQCDDGESEEQLNRSYQYFLVLKLRTIEHMDDFLENFKLTKEPPLPMGYDEHTMESNVMNEIKNIKNELNLRIINDNFSDAIDEYIEKFDYNTINYSKIFNESDSDEDYDSDHIKDYDIDNNGLNFEFSDVSGSSSQESVGGRRKRRHQKIKSKKTVRKSKRKYSTKKRRTCVRRR